MPSLTLGQVTGHDISIVYPADMRFGRRPERDCITWQLCLLRVIWNTRVCRPVDDNTIIVTTGVLLPSCWPHPQRPSMHDALPTSHLALLVSSWCCCSAMAASCLTLRSCPSSRSTVPSQLVKDSFSSTSRAFKLYKNTTARWMSN